MSLQGKLADFGVAEVFQLIAQQRKTGVLEVESDGSAVEIFFREGVVIRALPAEKDPGDALAGLLLRTGALPQEVIDEARRKRENTLESLTNLLLEAGALSEEEAERSLRLISDETIFELFLYDDGRFLFRTEEVGSQLGDQEIGAEQVLLDALRMKDEWSRVQLLLPDLSVVLTQSIDIDTLPERRDLLAAEANVPPEALERLFRLADGRLSARRIIDLSRLGTFVGARGLAALRRAGALRAGAPAAGDARPSTSAGRLHSASALAIVSLVLAFAVGAGLLAWPAPTPTDGEVPADLLVEARDSASAERLRLRLEALRWARGGYPARIEEAAEALEPASTLLAAGSGARYIYARSEGGYSLDRALP